MKICYTSLAFILVTFFLSGCGGNKNLQETAPAQFQQAYYTADASSMTLFLPVSAIQTGRVELTGVYFQGRKADLERDPQYPGMYVASFDTGKPDMIMSSDPREEYGNKVPEAGEKIPFDLDDDEAVIIFNENDTQKFYKLRNVEHRQNN